MRNNNGRQIKVRLVIWSILALIIILIAAFGEHIAPFEAYEQNLSQALMKPDSTHLAGTDQYGRDVLSRVITGANISVFSSLILVLIICVTGSFIGIICGYFGGILDNIFMRIADIFLAFPGIVFAIAVASVLKGGIVSAVIALAFVTWPKYARLARSQVLAVKDSDYIYAAKMSGLNNISIIIRHIIPNIADMLIVTAFLDIGNMIMEIAGLSFLGLGAVPPAAEWGAMISGGRSFLQTAPWIIIAPGAAIFICVFIFNMLSDAIRDVLEVKQ